MCFLGIGFLSCQKVLFVVKNEDVSQKTLQSYEFMFKAQSFFAFFCEKSIELSLNSLFNFADEVTG